MCIPESSVSFRRIESGHRRQEKAFLADSMRLLMDGGLLILSFLITAPPDVCLALCENFDNLPGVPLYG